MYFTVLSNLFCVCVFGAMAFRTFADIRNDGIHGSSSISPYIKGCVLLCILLTMLVYHFILIPYALKINPYQSLKASDVIFHYVIPFMMLFDWILFDEKGNFKWFDPIAWMLIPYLYVVFVFIQSRFEIEDRINEHMNRYIYAFLDVGTLGVNSVLLNILYLTVAFLIVGFFIYGVDRIRIKI